MMTTATGHTWTALKCRFHRGRIHDDYASLRGLLGALHDMATWWAPGTKSDV